MANNKQKRINRNNRKRGSAFEKRVADYLDMDVVPYSGSNSRFGWGDVRDTVWLGECKNITPNGHKITIKTEWIYKNEERAKQIDHIPFLAWMPAGSPNKFILLDIDVFTKLNMKSNHIKILENKSHNTKNIILHLNENYMKIASKAGNCVELHTNDMVWFLMNIETFKKRINEIGLKGERITI